MKKNNGYTLIELLISVTMIGIIIVIIGLAMRLGLRTVDSGERRIGSLERFRASLNIVDSQIQSALVIATQEEAGQTFLFKGDGLSMQFPSNYSLWSGRRGYVMVSYKVMSDAWGKQELHVEESATGEPGRGDVRLFDFLDHIYFEYFYKGPTDEKGTWTDQWSGTDTMPDKIRLHLVNGRSETLLIIPMKVGGPQDATVSIANVTNG